MSKPQLVSQECLWATRLELYETGFTAEFNQQLVHEILRQEEVHLKAAPKSQIGNFPPFSSLYKQQRMNEWPHPSVSELTTALREIARSYLSRSFEGDCEILGIDMWANIHRPANWHGPHSHFVGGSETLSGVYWALCPEIRTEANGALIFPDSRGPYHPGRYKKVVIPEPGRAILFPSWQQHYVAPIEPGHLRISVGFDVLCGRIIP